jgi:signal peptide peptidase SppA
MSHEIRRVLRAFATRAWFIDPRKAEEIVALLEFRAANGPRSEPYRAEPVTPQPVGQTQGKIAVLRLYGSIVPRMEHVRDVSASAASMVDFQRAFRAAAADPAVKAIVLDIDSPGGTVDLVPETAAMIREAHSAERPVIAVANTLAASAAYWLASAAGELVVTPSGEVGSIGVYLVHQDVSRALEAEGVAVTFISEGPRKVEGNPFEPLTAESRAALQANVRHYYDLFTRDVAKYRNVPVAVVRADPEKDEQHFGGGRVYPASVAVKLGMADRVDTLEGTIRRLMGGSEPRNKRRADLQRRRLALA